LLNFSRDSAIKILGDSFAIAASWHNQASVQAMGFGCVNPGAAE
jgi:hypothetical protein